MSHISTRMCHHSSRHHITIRATTRTWLDGRSTHPPPMAATTAVINHHCATHPPTSALRPRYSSFLSSPSRPLHQPTTSREELFPHPSLTNRRSQDYHVNWKPPTVPLVSYFTQIDVRPTRKVCVWCHQQIWIAAEMVISLLTSVRKIHRLLLFDFDACWYIVAVYR